MARRRGNTWGLAVNCGVAGASCEGRGARYFLYCIGDIAFFGCVICDNTRKRMAVKRLAQVGERTGSGVQKKKGYCRNSNL